MIIPNTIAVIFTITFLQFATCIDYDGWINIKIEHSIDCNNEKYCQRGNIALKSIRAGTPVIEQIEFKQQHINELKSLAEIDGFYSVRTIVTSAENIQGSEFLSSMKAQAFLDNSLSDVINVWVLPNGGVAAVSFQTTNNTKTTQYGKGKAHKISTNFYLHHIDQAPVPDTASYIQKLEREREAREKGELKDNRSFLAKYWMYIVPFAIFVMISGAANPEPPAQASR